MPTVIIAGWLEGFGQPPARMLPGEMEKLASTQLPAADHIERLLDDALEQTFPASDPVAVGLPSTEPVAAGLRQLP